MAETDEELVARFRAGDMGAFAAIFVRYHRAVHRFVYRLAGREWADDLTQDAFVRAFVGLRAGTGCGELRPWIYRVARNLCLDHIRRRGRSPVVLSSLPAESSRGHAPSAEEEALRAEEVDRIESVLGSLAEIHRTVLVLRDLGGMSYREIGQVIQASEAAVKSLIYRARREFRARYLLPEAGGRRHGEADDM